MEYVNIIKTDIVDSKYDVFWNDISSFIKDAAPRPVLVVVNGCAEGSADSLQLRKMLDACNLLPEQYNIVRLQDNEQAAWRQLRERLEPRIVFLIGVMPAQLGISAFFILHVPNHFNDRIWLPTVAIAELEKHADVKKQLWTNGMKPVFIDKS
jgi:hypothetical protein